MEILAYNGLKVKINIGYQNRFNNINTGLDVQRMAKKIYVPVTANGKPIKLFLDDVKKVHQIAKRKLPALPAYNRSIVPSKKWE